MLVRVLFALAIVFVASAQSNPSWSRPFPPHKIAGNLYYVGTEDLACFLLTDPQGHILINTGLADSAPMIRDSIRKLGFRIEDVKILLAMQGHFDHVAAMRDVQKMSGAQVWITEADAPAVEDGGKSDPMFHAPKLRFPPVKVDRRLKDGDTVRVGGTELRVILTPGHSKGSVSYATTVGEGSRRLRVLLANMATVVMPLVGNSKYPGIADDFARTFDKQKALDCDIWVAAHASQYGMREKQEAGSFIDPAGYKAAVARYERMFRAELAKERGGNRPPGL